MKLLGVLWNSIGDKKDEAIKEIQKYGSVLYYDVDLGDNYKKFLEDLYPFNESEKLKAEFKINGLVNKYKDNSIRIVFIDMPKSEKVYLQNKDKMMYKNVLELKVYLRKKYKHLIIDNNTENQKSYDNVFHMTDDELEYEKDLCVLMNHIPFIFERRDGFLILDSFIDKEQTFFEKWGTRNKIWLNNKILFKENTEGTYESYCEVFNMYLLKRCGLNYAYYDLAKKIVNILLIPNGVINTIVYPRIVQTKNKIFVRRVLWLRIGVALLIYGGLLCFASFIVKVLGGVEMLAAVPVVNVLGGLIIITALEYYLGGTVLVAFNHGKEFNLSVIYALFVYLLMVSGLIACNVVTLYSIIIVALLNELFTTLYRWYYCRKYKLL